jgi:hypothetical protein
MKRLSYQDRIDNYHRVTGFPKALFLGGDGRIVGMWVMGNNYQVKSSYYGGYPHGYLARVKALFPDKKQVLHLFSGQVDTEIFPGTTLDSNLDNWPDILADAHDLSKIKQRFDLILADPPYSIEDSVHYGTPMINRNKVLSQASMLLKKGGHLVWLDQVLPMYRKDNVITVGYIGMVKSTNHRFRVITIFEKL